MAEVALNGNDMDDAASGGTTAGIPHQFTPDDTPSMAPIVLGGNNHRGNFGEQFVSSLAIAANLDVSKTMINDDIGIDCTLSRKQRSGRIRFPKIEVQVKCWSRPRGNPDAWRYPLRVHNYNHLAGKDFDVPRFLFLVISPVDQKPWVDVDEERFLMRHAAYWACFHDAEVLSGRPKDSTFTVSVPRANLLDVTSLDSLFDPVHREGLMT